MKETLDFVKTTHIVKASSVTHPSFKDEISSYKQAIKKIKNNHKEKLIASQKQLEDQQVSRSAKKRLQQQEVQQTQAFKVQTPQQDLKNKTVNDTDKMLYEKKFKNFLNHRQQFQAQSKKRQQKIMQDRKNKDKGQIQIQYEYPDQEQILKDENGENLFKDASEMIGFYEEITLGKKNKKGTVHLFHGQKVQENFRRSEFDYLLQIENEMKQNANETEIQSFSNSINKDTLLEYLFNEPAVMMLYSINPYQLGDELAEFQTLNLGLLTFEDFSKFLLIDREPTYFQYTRENLQEARKIGRGIKCQPIISKWIGDGEIYDWLIETFQALDILGQRKVERQVLVRKLRKECQKKRLLNEQIIQIVNINKLITIDRILYEIEHSTELTDKITEQFFVNLLNHYHRLRTPEKDKLITKLILNGKYNPSYVFILGNQALEIFKETFNSLQKYAEYFVTKQKFVEKLVKNPKFNKIRTLPVRSQGNRYVKMQSVETSLVRFLSEAENFVDIQEILDFFTNRGRPIKVQHQIYLANLQRQLKNIQQEELKKQKNKLSEEDLSTSSDEQEFIRTLKQKNIERKKQKLASIRAAQNFAQGKKFNVTVPTTFSFGDGVKQKTKISIRQKKLRQQLDEKRRAQQQSMVPIKPKPVPQHVKQDLYQKILREQERQRKQRLERFRLQSQQNMISISPHLLSKPKSKSIYEIKTSQDKFVAKPLPWYCEVNLLQRIQKEKDERRERILEEIIDKHNDSDLPEGFKKMIERGEKTQQEKQRARALSKTTANDKECIFNPKITQGIPDFKMIHEHLQIDLENKKQQKQPIKVIPFSFQNRPYRSQTAVQPQKHLLHPKKELLIKQEEHEINIPITQKHLAFVNMRKKQGEQKVQKQQEEKRASTVRKMRQQKFAPYVRQVLRKSRIGDMSQSKALIESKIKQFKKQERKRKRQYEEQMIKIYTKVFNRPLLVEGQGEHKTDQQNKEHEIHKSRSRSNKPAQKVRESSRKQVQHFAEDYDMPQASGQPVSKRNPNQQQYDDLRRKAIEHPPRNYLMEEQNGYENEDDGQNPNQQYDYDEQYLSENGRYTN